MAQTSRRRVHSYADRLTSPPPRFRDVVRLFRQYGGFGELAADAPSIPVASAGSLSAVEPGTMSVTWNGHATFVIRAGGMTILTDPVWSRRIPGVPKRLTPPGVPWEALPTIDAVVISHNHYDHLDAPTIRRLPRHTPVLVPANLGLWFRRRGFTHVSEFDWWESRRIGLVTFDFVPAHHWSRRSPTDTCRTLWGGWVLAVDGGRRVYFAGDTGYGHFFRDIGDRYPDIDLALLPVGAYEPQWFMRPMHLTPEEAVRACDDVGAPRMATMHWGTFILSREPVTEPPERAAKEWAATGHDRDQLWDLAVGETRTL